MLAASREAALINEPFNRFHPTGVMRARVRWLYPYVSEENESEYLLPMRETLAYRYHYWAQLNSHPAKDVPRAMRDAIGFLSARLAGKRPLLKDPFAVLSVPWFLSRLHCQVVIVVRHPLAFASSLKRLDWSFDFGDLLAQPVLMDRLLSSYRADMERAQRQPTDVISQASLLWRIIYGTVAQYRAAHPGIHVVRHEDLSLNPLLGFQQLYNALGLSFTPLAKQTVVRSSGQENPTELAPQDPHSVQLNSRANLENWKHRLTPDEIGRVTDATSDVFPLFYSNFEQNRGFEFVEEGVKKS